MIHSIHIETNTFIIPILTLYLKYFHNEHFRHICKSLSCFSGPFIKIKHTSLKTFSCFIFLLFTYCCRLSVFNISKLFLQTYVRIQSQPDTTNGLSTRSAQLPVPIYGQTGSWRTSLDRERKFFNRPIRLANEDYVSRKVPGRFGPMHTHIKEICT